VKSAHTKWKLHIEENDSVEILKMIYAVQFVGGFLRTADGVARASCVQCEWVNW
jgi:hypothetical protein